MKGGHGFDLAVRMDNLRGEDSGEIQIIQYKAQFFKQGPAYKKEGPDPNKGSNQQ